MAAGSADGTISIWNAGGDWEHLKTMRGHKSAVNSLAVHSSGRVALSVSRDATLRMWNLGKGRNSYTAKLDGEGDLVKFCPSGEVRSKGTFHVFLSWGVGWRVGGHGRGHVASVCLQLSTG